MDADRHGNDDVDQLDEEAEHEETAPSPRRHDGVEPLLVGDNAGHETDYKDHEDDGLVVHVFL